MDKPSLIQFFNDLAPRWDEICVNDEARLRCLVELCNIKKDSRILDIACGTGVLTPYLLLKKPKLLLGVDFACAMIEIANKKYSDPCLEYRCMDVMDLSDDGFDCAILYSAFPHFENRGSLTRQIHHLLAVGGRIMICHSQGRTDINAHHQATAAQVAMPLPAAQTLSHTLSQYFDVDISIDSPAFYVVSGIKRNL